MGVAQESCRDIRDLNARCADTGATTASWFSASIGLPIETSFLGCFDDRDGVRRLDKLSHIVLLNARAKNSFGSRCRARTSLASR
jgi:hypothetical protein